MDSNITDYARLESGGEYGRFDTDVIHPLILVSWVINSWSLRIYETVM
ncbi:MAG: hypothetical protein U9Q22_06145 [Candidatus Altiarchaeota archaeon]|nr:hypothetical protein [Candidatus Altiarchaeota archaeon]